MPGHYKVGFMYENRSHATWELPTQTPEVRKGGSQEWLQFDQMVVRQGPGATDGIIVIGNYNHNDPRYSVRQDQFNIAAIDRDFWKARPLDTIGVLFNYQTVSSRLSRIQSEEVEFGLPISGGDFGTFPGAQGVQNHVFNVELNYQIHVFRGVTFAPDFQYSSVRTARATCPTPRWSASRPTSSCSRPNSNGKRAGRRVCPLFVVHAVPIRRPVRRRLPEGAPRFHR